jgi:hypothetical protein
MRSEAGPTPTLAYEVSGRGLHGTGEDGAYNDSLVHLMFFRDMVRRAERLDPAMRERAVECGWEFGDFAEMYGYDGYTSHLNRIFWIFDLPNSGRDPYIEMGVETEDLGGMTFTLLFGRDAGEQLVLTEEDLIVGMPGTAQEAAKLACGLLMVNPESFAGKLALRDYPEDEADIMAHPGSLADAFAREEARKKERIYDLCVVYGMSGMEPYCLYDYLFKDLIRMWEVWNGGA